MHGLWKCCNADSLDDMSWCYGAEAILNRRCTLCLAQVEDLSLQDYIMVKHAIVVPHTAGRYSVKRFRKANCPIVERYAADVVFPRCELGPGERRWIT